MDWVGRVSSRITTGLRRLLEVQLTLSDFAPRAHRRTKLILLVRGLDWCRFRLILLSEGVDFPFRNFGVVYPALTESQKCQAQHSFEIISFPRFCFIQCEFAAPIYCPRGHDDRLVPQYRGLPGASLTGMLFYVLLAPVVS